MNINMSKYTGTGIRVSFIMFLFLLLACQKDKLLRFEMEYESEFTIPQTGPVGALGPLNTPDIETSSEQKFENHNTRADLVKDVKLSDLDLTITNPEDETFSFLEKIVIYIKADNLPEKELGRRENIPDDAGSRLSLHTTGEKLDPYIKKETFSIKIEATIDETIPQDTDVVALMVFDVTANPL